MGARCKKHPLESLVGICSVCLRQRLTLLAKEEDNALQQPFNDVYLQPLPLRGLHNLNFHDGVINGPEILSELPHFHPSQLSNRIPIPISSPRSESAATRSSTRLHALYGDENRIYNIQGKSKRRMGFSLLSVFKNIGDIESKAKAHSTCSSTHKKRAHHANSQPWKEGGRHFHKEDSSRGRASVPKKWKRPSLNCHGKLISDQDVVESKAFICLDLERNDSKPWISSFQRKSSRHLQRKRFSSLMGDSSCSVSAKPSLPKNSSTKSTSQYEMRVLRKRGGHGGGGMCVSSVRSTVAATVRRRPIQEQERF